MKKIQHWSYFPINILVNTTARVTIETFWARSGQDASKKWARTFTDFDIGTVDFTHVGVQVSRKCTKFYGAESFGYLSIAP
jgi:hypothetical protein